MKIHNGGIATVLYLPRALAAEINFNLLRELTWPASYRYKKDLSFVRVSLQDYLKNRINKMSLAINNTDTQPPFDRKCSIRIRSTGNKRYIMGEKST